MAGTTGARRRCRSQPRGRFATRRRSCRSQPPAVALSGHRRLGVGARNNPGLPPVPVLGMFHCRLAPLFGGECHPHAGWSREAWAPSKLPAAAAAQRGVPPRRPAANFNQRASAFGRRICITEAQGDDAALGQHVVTALDVAEISTASNASWSPSQQGKPLPTTSMRRASVTGTLFWKRSAVAVQSRPSPGPHTAAEKL